MRGWVGQQEHGQNRGYPMDEANSFVGNPLGSPYCAATGSRALYLAGVAKPKSGLARNMRTKETYSAWLVINGVKKIREGDGLIWQKGATVFGHFGFADADWNSTKGRTIEANTSSGYRGSQSNGDGIYGRWRSLSPTSYFRIVAVTPLH